jgi:protein O-mannosyl-transferase
VGPAVLVFVASFLAYFNNLGNGFVYDDRYVIERNPLVQSLDWWGLVSKSYWGTLVDAGLYRPFTLLSFGLNRLLGSSAFGFHLTNDVLHAAASVAVLLLARRLGLGRTGSVGAALAFAVHPVQTEAVDALVGRADILAFGLVALALLLFLRGSHAVAVGATYFLALSAKESAAFALPLFFFAAEDRRAARFAPLGAAGVAYGLARVLVLGGLGISGREIGFLDNPFASAGLGTRLLAAPALVLEYVRLIVWPRVLSADYSFDQIPAPVGAFDHRVVAGTAILLCLAVVAWRAPSLRFAAVAFLVPLGFLLHVAVPLGTLMAERLLYLPLLGVALGFGTGIETLARRSARVAFLLLALLVTAGATRVRTRNLDWRDNEALFRKTVATSPRSARSHFLLGAELLERKEYPRAAEAFEAGLAIYPEHFGARMSLGQALLGAGDPLAAERAFYAALQAEPRSGDARKAATEAALEAGRNQAREGDLKSARASFERARSLDETEPAVWNDLGLVSEQEGGLDEARSDYERALALDDHYTPVVLNLASVRMRAGELEAATALFRRAIELAPDSYEAYNGLGVALARLGRSAEAAKAFRKAIEIDPTLETAKNNLSALGGTAGK